MRAALTISLPRFLRQKLDQAVKEEHLNRSDVVREALRQFFAVRQFRRLRGLAVPLAEKQGFFTDEEIFKQIS